MRHKLYEWLVRKPHIPSESRKPWYLLKETNSTDLGLLGMGQEEEGVGSYPGLQPSPLAVLGLPLSPLSCLGCEDSSVLGPVALLAYPGVMALYSHKLGKVAPDC